LPRKCREDSSSSWHKGLDIIRASADLSYKNTSRNFVSKIHKDNSFPFVFICNSFCSCARIGLVPKWCSSENLRRTFLQARCLFFTHPINSVEAPKTTARMASDIRLANIYTYCFNHCISWLPLHYQSPVTLIPYPKHPQGTGRISSYREDTLTSTKPTYIDNYYSIPRG